MVPDMEPQNYQERRKAPRFDVFFAMPTLKSISRIDGHEVDLINISRLGALIDSDEQMPPGARVVFRAVTAETVYIFKGRITRCGVSPRVEKMFQSGIEFDEEFTFLPVSIELLQLFEDDRDFLQ